jgi:hypothetical protein
MGRISRIYGEIKQMPSPADRCLKKTLQLAERMLRLANNGDAVRDDPGCGVVYGVLRDSAYKLKQLVEAEQQAHLLKRPAQLSGLSRPQRREQLR